MDGRTRRLVNDDDTKCLVCGSEGPCSTQDVGHDTVPTEKAMAWVRRALAAEFQLHEIRELAQSITEQSQGFTSAWEFDHGIDAEHLHQRLAEIASR